MRALLLPFVFVFLASTDAFYFPGWRPEVFSQGQKVDLWFNKIFSDRTQLPFAYNDLPFVCRSETSESSALNLGEVFRGDRIVKSDIDIRAGQDVDCKKLCTASLQDSLEWKSVRELIKDDYRAEWIVDDLPSATPTMAIDKGRKYEIGFHLGGLDHKEGQSGDDADRVYINNHFALTVRYRQQQQQQQGTDGIVIVGFEVHPQSVASFSEDCKPIHDSKSGKLFVEEGLKSITYSYGVKWVLDETITWAHRWENYIDSSNSQVHWYSIINSMMLMIFLTVIVAIIILRTLNKDIAGYNEDLHLEGQEDVVGWKLVHGDVFRPPRRLMLLTTLLGSGTQLFAALLLTLLFGIIGVLNPSYRGGLLHVGLFFFVFCALFGGYQSARILKSFNGQSWKTNAFWTAAVFPLFLFTVVCILNTFSWVQGSSKALPFGTFAALIFMWLLIDLPLVYVGAYFGFKKQAIDHPVRTHQIPRQIPQQSPYLQLIPSLAIGGIMPFAVIFMELFFILKSMWQDQYYYMFGFLALVTLLLFITCIETTIVFIYFQLCAEDYRWHWKSFLVSSSSAWYILLFGIYYYSDKLDYDHRAFMPGLYFFSYLVIGGVVYGFSTGMVGFFATYKFMRVIYAAVKID